MQTDVALESLSPSELIALVHELRRQLTEREQEIERLKQPAPAEPAQSVLPKQDSDETAIPEPGSQEDLLAQLEWEYPGG